MGGGTVKCWSRRVLRRVERSITATSATAGRLGCSGTHMRRLAPHRPPRRSLAAAARPPARARRPPPTVGDRERLRHARAPERDRHPRLDERASTRRPAHVHALPRPVPARRRPLAAAQVRSADRLGLDARRGGPQRRARLGLELRASSRPPRAARTSCAASCSSSGGAAASVVARVAGDDDAGPPGHRRRRPERLQRRHAARSPSRRSNRRGSFVITPVTPSASSRADLLAVVDRPHVEVAARLAQRAQQRAA